MEILGYAASVFIGISLGLIGGGGSILTVPVLVYLLGVDAFLATEYSLFIVGISSLAGSFSYFKKGLVNFKTAVIFGIPSVVSIFLTRHYLLPLIPDEVFHINSLTVTVTKDIFLLLVFAGLMIVSSYKMISKSVEPATGTVRSEKNNTLQAAGQGCMVGMLTGLVGAGGGFMIIPALVGLLKTPMKAAVGTSLVIIAVNSLIGFFSSINHVKIQWNVSGTVSAMAVVGIVIGSQLSDKINGAKLKPAFGWFILVMGVYIIIRELFL